MKGRDWGRLIARLFALLLLHNGITGLVDVLFTVRGRLITSDVLTWSVGPAITIVFAVLLWAFAGRFAPGSVADEGPGDQSHAAGTVVASVAAYFALTYAYWFIETLLVSQAQSGDPSKETPHLALFFYLVVSILCIATLFYSRRIAAWIAR